MNELRKLSLRLFNEKRDIIDKYGIDNGNSFVKTIFGVNAE